MKFKRGDRVTARASHLSGEFVVVMPCADATAGDANYKLIREELDGEEWEWMVHERCLERVTP
jgi:hypothetical protein